MLEDKHNNKGHAAITETNFPVIMEASGKKPSRLWVNSSHYCLWMHLSASPLLVSSCHFPFHLPLCFDSGNELKTKKTKKNLGPVWDFSVLWPNSLHWGKKRKAPCSFWQTVFSSIFSTLPVPHRNRGVSLFFFFFCTQQVLPPI